MNGDAPNAKQIVQAALRGADIPRYPVGPLAVHYCARAAGASLQRYTTDPDVLADCVVKYHQQFSPDAVWLSADTWVTAEAMGAAVDFPGRDQPLGGIGAPRVRTVADIDNIPPPNAWSQGRFPLMLKALRRIREALGPDVFLVACFDQYPFSLACALMGIEVAMVKLFEDRPMLEAVMERGLEYGMAYARALAEAGADMLSGGDSAAGLIGPELYQDAALPFARRLIAGLKSSLNLPVSLHICGNATPILSLMSAAGADVLELDHACDIRTACRILGGQVAIWGNLDPVGVLSRGTPETVCCATRRLLQAIQDCGHRRFVLSSGCTLAVETPSENLRAMFRTAREYSLTKPRAQTIYEGLHHGG